jgi:hypothetical protein
MRNIQRAPTWEATVQKPGVGHRARSSDVDDIKSLQRKVSNSKGRAALMAAVELQKAQRRARGE